MLESMNWDMVRAFINSSDKGTRIAGERRMIEEMEKHLIQEALESEN